jgi:hypothetical protein
MVFMKIRCNVEDEKATIGVRMTTSRPDLSLKSLKSSSQDPILEINLHLRCLASKQPSRPITFLTSGSVVDTTKPDYGHLDNLALGKLGPGLVCDNAVGGRKVISFGYFKIHRARQDGDDAPNLRERPDNAFVTVPAQDSGEELTVTHTLTAERLFEYAEGITPEDLQIGERYNIYLGDGHLGASWWCWGGLETDLKDKKLHAFSRGEFHLLWRGNEPSKEELQNDNWAIGECISQLSFVVEEGGGTCAVEVVE